MEINCIFCKNLMITWQFLWTDTIFFFLSFLQGKTAADIADEEITELIEKLEKKQKDRENTKAVRLLILLPNIKHLIQKRFSSELLHCALRIVAYPDRKAPWM